MIFTRIWQKKRSRCRYRHRL